MMSTTNNNDAFTNANNNKHFFTTSNKETSSNVNYNCDDDYNDDEAVEVTVTSPSSRSNSSSTTTNASSSFSSQLDRADEENEEKILKNDNEEFDSIIKRCGHILSIDIESANNKVTTTSASSSLKYLFKLLKFHKLEHYMIDLLEKGFHTPLSLHKLNTTSETCLEKLIKDVSPYDKKKFSKLKLFIKQVINTINTNKAKHNSKNNHRKSSKNLSEKMNGNNLVVNERIDDLYYLSMGIQHKPSNMNHSSPYWNELNNQAGKKLASSANTKSSLKLVKKAPIHADKSVSRAKSTECILKQSSNTKTNLNDNYSSSKSIANLDQIGEHVASSVRHLSSHSHSRATKKTSETTNYFGPKLNQHINTEPAPIANVKYVKTQSYNYGVPLSQHQQQSHNLNKASLQVINTSSKSKLLNGNADIFVYARKRPMLSFELTKFTDVISFEEVGNEQNSEPSNKLITKSICVNEVKSALDGTPILRKNEFAFDKTFDATFSNDDIFKTSILPFIEANKSLNDSRRNDFSCICFGQTGSGKTHTLFGTKQQDGICVLTAQSLFATSEKICCGFYEIYNGQLYDLINKKNRLVLREDSTGQVNVVGLVEIEIKNLNDLRKIIEQAQANRHIGTTSFNKASSRSHGIVQFKIFSQKNSTNGPVNQMNNKYSNSAVKSKVNSGLNAYEANKQHNKPFKIMFIDLAGSERGIDAQNNIQDNRKEGAEINQSLLALKECIRCIDQFCSHAPFRQSKLTRVLRDCFVGCGRTVLIATVSPTDDCVPCSLNTLQYANRVRQMTMRNRSTNAASVLNSARSDVDKTKHQIQMQNNHALTKTKNFVVLNGHQTSKKPVNSNNQQLKEDNIAETKRPLRHGHLATSKDSSKNQTASKSFKLPFSQSTAFSIKLPKQRSNELNKVKTNIDSQNILPSKQMNTNNGNAKTEPINHIFHPSKINMSSTPIKRLSDIENVNVNVHNFESTDRQVLVNNGADLEQMKNLNDFVDEDYLVFANDTPIKGHKLKYLSATNSNVIAQLAERYFSRSEHAKVPQSVTNTNLPSQACNINENKCADELNSKIYYKKPDYDNNSNEFINNLKVKNSMLKSLIKNKVPSKSSSSVSLSSSASSSVSNKYTERYKSICKLDSPPLKSTQHVVPQNETLFHDSEVLIKLRQKLEATKSKPLFCSSQNTTVNNFLFNNQSDSVNLNSQMDQVNETELNSAASSSNVQNKQLKNYIHNLETKLENLRSEMENKRNRSLSVSSSDSCEEIGMLTGSTKNSANVSTNFFSNQKIYNEFLQRRHTLQQQQQQHHKQQQQQSKQHSQLIEQLKLNKLMKNDDDDDETEKQFLLKQTKMNQNESNSSSDCDDFDNFGDEKHGSLKNLKKSLHKGSSSEMFLSKLKSLSVSSSAAASSIETKKDSGFNENKQPLLVDTNNNLKIAAASKNLICQFSPIIHIENFDGKQEQEDAKSRVQTSSPSSKSNSVNHLVNPIPIRLLSSSSSFDSTSLNKSLISSVPKLSYQNGSDLEHLNAFKNDDDLDNNSKSQTMSSLKLPQNNKSKIWRSTLNSSSDLSDKNQQHQPRSANTWSSILLNDNQMNDFKSSKANTSEVFKAKDSLVMAHENQLSDLAETCKKEVSLLNCLKESQVGFDEYINQVEEILAKKANSISNLKMQINQLKTFSNSNGNINKIAAIN